MEPAVGAQTHRTPRTLRSFKLRHVDRHVRLVGTDGHAADLFGAEYERFAAAAAGLSQLVAGRCSGGVRAISVNFERQVLLATFEAAPRPGVLRIDGSDFVGEVAPLCTEAGRWALPARGPAG